MTLRCEHSHIPPFDAVELPDVKFKRPGWARLICRQCGVFLGYRSPEEVAKAGFVPVDLENSEKEPESGA